MTIDAEEAGEWLRRLIGALMARPELKPTPQDQLEQIYGLQIKKTLHPPVALTPEEFASRLSDEERAEFVRLVRKMLGE